MRQNIIAVLLSKSTYAIWGNQCTHCMACICYCPTEAIKYGKKSIGKPRYHFEQLKMTSLHKV
ncbi:4Fe-4S binding protein [uncultured Eubacterium sp.]|uniref:4Fe-4S binding protein n=1 Tax=uncultured Eubacterium sp. TaxID=165185 RepID=UPI00341CA5A1